MHLKKLSTSLICAVVLLVSTASAAPVVVIPGESAGYVYYSAGGSGTPAAPVADTSFVGMIAAFSTTPPADTWVVCNGQTISAAAYPELVEFLAGSAAASAVMPNYQGYFLRGANTGAAGLDPSRTVGSVQGDDNKSHSHTGTTSTNGAHTHTVALFYGVQVPGPNQVSLRDGVAPLGASNWPTSTDGAHSHTFTTANTGGTETRPHNIAVIYAMRAK